MKYIFLLYSSPKNYFEREVMLVMYLINCDLPLFWLIHDASVDDVATSRSW